MVQPTKTPIEAGLIARVASGVRYAVTGKAPIWMSPMEAMLPVVAGAEIASVEGRGWDYDIGFNQRITPRQGEAVNFATLRMMADGYDLMRLAIETRKDQISKLDFTIKPMDDAAEPDARCKEVQEFLRFPDKENSWHDWLRMLVEDMLVTDAASVYARKTLGGKPYAFELVDGGTVTRKINAFGRTPLPPEAAYQQVMKGVPTINYTTDELHYAPRNKRTNKAYGFSPVEQIITTVNIALRRQLSQMQYYTDGSSPNLIMFAPAEWTPEQIARFQLHWDSMLKGNTAERAGAKMVPNGVVPYNTKEAVLKDDFDDWLARIVCFAFSISAQALTKSMNRATAETAATQAIQEGLMPVMNWVKGVIDGLIFKQFGYTDLQFVWDIDTSVDPLIQAQIDQIYIATQVKSPDEVRVELGYDVMTPDERESAFPTPTPMIDPLSEQGMAANQSNQQAPASIEPIKPTEKFEIHNHIAVSPPDVVVDIGKTHITVNTESVDIPRLSA